MEIRHLTSDDADASLRMSREAFGVPMGDRAAFTLGPGTHRWGLFDGATLAAKTVAREYTSMIGGRPVSTAGIAGVAVAPEYRGTGLARRLMADTMTRARDSGAVISTLFRTAPGLYRSLGYEQVAELVIGELPGSALAGLRVPPTVGLRRAATVDAPAIRAVYAQVAAEGSCLLTRTGPCFTATDADLLASFDGISLAVGAGGSVDGYLSWHRGEGTGAGATLSAGDLLAVNRDALTALLALAGSFGAVTPMVRLRTSGSDPIHWVIPGAGWSVCDVRQYLLRVVDLPGAVAQRGWPRGLSGTVELTVDDPVCPWNSGRHRLVLAGGDGRLEAGSGAGVTLAVAGLSLLIAGGVTCAELQRAGMIGGGSAADHWLLDAAMAGPRPAILDYF